MSDAENVRNLALEIFYAIAETGAYVAAEGGDASDVTIDGHGINLTEVADKLLRAGWRPPVPEWFGIALPTSPTRFGDDPVSGDTKHEGRGNGTVGSGCAFGDDREDLAATQVQYTGGPS